MHAWNINIAQEKKKESFPSGVAQLYDLSNKKKEREALSIALSWKTRPKKKTTGMYQRRAANNDNGDAFTFERA